MKKGLVVGLSVLAVLALAVGAAWGGTIYTTASGSGDYSQSVYIDHDDPLTLGGPNWGADVRESINIANAATLNVNSCVSNWYANDFASMTTAATGVGSINAGVEFHDMVDSALPGANNFHTVSSSSGAWLQGGNAGQTAGVSNFASASAVGALSVSTCNIGNSGGYGATQRAQISDYPPYPRPNATHTIMSGAWGPCSQTSTLQTTYGAANDTAVSNLSYVGLGDGYLTPKASNVSGLGPTATQHVLINGDGVIDGSNFSYTAGGAPFQGTLNGAATPPGTFDYNAWLVIPVTGFVIDTQGR